MPKITYIAPEGDAAEVKWGAFVFKANVPTDCDDKHILKKAKTNPHFEVEGEPKKERKSKQKAEAKPAEKPEGEPKKERDPFAEGVEAAKAGGDGVVPEAYRGKPEEQAWTDGFLSVDEKA